MSQECPFLIPAAQVAELPEFPFRHPLNPDSGIIDSEATQPFVPR